MKGTDTNQSCYNMLIPVTHGANVMADERHADLTTRSFLPNVTQRSAKTAELVMTLLTHPQLAMIGARATSRLFKDGSISLSRSTPEFILPDRQLGRPLGDPAISRKPLTLKAAAEGGLDLIRGENQTSVQVEGVQVGEGFRFNAKQLEQGVILTLSERALILLQWRACPPPPRVGRHMGMIGHSEGLALIRAEIEKVATLNVPVLIRGETGTGKELVAHALHRCGKRHNRPFIDVNLGALPHTLAAAELFGVRRGAFTGAAENKLGYFRAAHGGVLFLDEIGEAPLEVQAMLLRLLETGQVAPVGTHELYAVDVRLISATDAHIEERIAAGAFKEPLLHRLAAYEIWVPPLRQRREDMGPLFLHFARETLKDLGDSGLPDRSDHFAPPWLPAELALRLARYSWPGNIRQFRNLVRKLIIGNQGQSSLQATPQVDRILGSGKTDHHAPPSSHSVVPRPRRKPARVTETELREALRRSGWEPKAAAERLNLARSSIYDLIRKYPGLQTAADLDPEQVSAGFERHCGDLETLADEFQVSKTALQRRIKAMGLDV